jgi:uncharacterized membrane protein YccC
MTATPLKPRAWHYVLKLLLGSLIAWYGLIALGLRNPYWAIITICIASDPDWDTAVKVTTARFLNTLVGGLIGLAGVIVGGVTPPTMFLCLTVTTILVTTLPRYPANWRLAPATVAIIMEVSVIEGQNRATEIRIAEQRVMQVFAGCIVALGLAWVFSRLHERFSRPPGRARISTR